MRTIITRNVILIPNPKLYVLLIDTWQGDNIFLRRCWVIVILWIPNNTVNTSFNICKSTKTTNTSLHPASRRSMAIPDIRSIIQKASSMYQSCIYFHTFPNKSSSNPLDAPLAAGAALVLELKLPQSSSSLTTGAGFGAGAGVEEVAHAFEEAPPQISFDETAGPAVGGDFAGGVGAELAQGSSNPENAEALLLGTTVGMGAGFGADTEGVRLKALIIDDELFGTAD